jgi:hypothetical protein
MYDHLAPYPTSGISALRILKRSGSMDGDAERNGSPCLSRWLGKHPSYRLPLHKPPPTPKILAWQRRRVCGKFSIFGRLLSIIIRIVHVTRLAIAGFYDALSRFSTPFRFEVMLPQSRIRLSQHF